MKLRPFDVGDSPTVSRWARTPLEAMAWCSIDSIPVEPEVITGWSTADDVVASVLVDEHDRLLAYGELWVDGEENETELAHLIVDPDERGRGLGQRLVSLLMATGPADHLVVLRVRPDNEPAIRCYTAAGFTPASADEQATWNLGQPVPYLWMVAAAD